MMAMDGVRARSRTIAAIAALALLTTACSGGGGQTSTAPTSAPASPSAAGATEAPADLASTIASLKTKLQGQKIVFGEGGFANPQIVVFHKIAQILAEDYGLVVDARVVDADPLVAALVSGEVQVGSLSVALTANTNAAGADFVAFGADQSKNTFMVAAKAPIATMAELKGKPFGGPQNLASITGQTSQKCFKEAGMDLEKDVQLIRFNNTGESTAALKADQVAGAITLPVRITPLALEDPNTKYNVLCKGWETNPQIASALIATRKLISENPDLVQAFAISSAKANKWAHEDKAGWIALAIEKLEGYSQERGEIDYPALVDDIDMWPTDGGLIREDCDKTLATSFEFGVIEKKLTCDDMADFSFQEAAVALVGQ